ncbi:hypothetical protein [Thalassotalea sp. G2M2-11]|uniref:hypothetical protein n=1 Tax=Thalassotalea sp. G2M2-11 TaxID=2787627 RepID=UPI0019D061D7|nr:hypothetical protein [Thalassotalea sp. G2M2-11]
MPKIEHLEQVKQKRRLKKLMLEYHDEFMQLFPSDGFRAISIFNGWEYTVSCWFMRKLDQEVVRNKDFIQISDIKYKHNYLSINYSSQLDIDYDEVIAALDNLNNENS